MGDRVSRHTLAFVAVLLGGVLLLNSNISSVVFAQTIPTRTPTPSGGQATATSDDGGDPGPNPTAPPTSTNAPPPVTVTSTRIVLPPTPEEGFLPTAEPCAPEVTARAVASGINVRSGPGLDYEIVGNLLLQEVRPVTGRAPQANWWQIILSDGTIGWVADNLVEISGHTAYVPTVEPPPLDSGVTVTPGTPWAPTPRPECPPTPTETPTATTTPTTSPTAAATGTEETAMRDDQAAGAATPTASQTATVTGTAATLEANPTDPPPTAAPLPGEEESSGGLPWIPIAGAGLLLAAAGAFIVQRLRS